MSEVKYKIMAPGSNNSMVATYENGELTALEGIHHMAKMWDQWCINAPVPLREKEISDKVRTYEGLVSIELIELSKNDAKIAAFCKKYREEVGVPYRRSLADVSAMRSVDVSDELLDTYFNNTEWWGKQPKSIRNYAKNYNALMQLLNQPKKAAKKKGVAYPDHYDREFARKLKGPQISAYWRHLRNLGLKPQKTATGTIIDWVKVGAVILLALFLQGCMTPNRVKRYIAEHPEIIEEKADTSYRTDTIPIVDEIIIPGDSAEVEWVHWWDEEPADTSWTKIPDGPHTNLSIEVKRKDEPATANEPRRTNYQVKARVEPDTVPFYDTLYIEVPEVREKVVVVRAGWKTKLLWAGAGALVLLLIGAIWRRRK